MDHHAPEVAALLDAVLTSAGAVDPTLREVIFRGNDTPEPWSAFVAKVREESYKVTDRDVEGLITAGCSQNAIFEITIAAATGAAVRRLDAGLRALEGGP